MSGSQRGPGCSHGYTTFEDRTGTVMHPNGKPCGDRHECPVAEEPLQTNRCPEPDKYGKCVCCGFRYGVACVCGMTFAERARLVGIDREALRRFHGN